MGSDSKLEAMLPARVMEKYEVVLDYQNRTLTFAQAGTIRPEGTPVSFRVNPLTGLIAVEALIDGQPYPVTIDNGSAYTWFRQDTAKSWVATHPDWKRGVGAVEASNMTMSGDGADAQGNRQCGDGCEAGGCAQHAQTVAGVLPEMVPPEPAAEFVEALLSRRDAAESPAGRRSCGLVALAPDPATGRSRAACAHRSRR